MSLLSEKEKNELIAFARSAKVREDFRHTAACRYNPFEEDGRVNADRVIEFLSEYNSFINHETRPLRKIVGKNIKL